MPKLRKMQGLKFKRFAQTIDIIQIVNCQLFCPTIARESFYIFHVSHTARMIGILFYGRVVAFEVVCCFGNNIIEYPLLYTV